MHLIDMKKNNKLEVGDKVQIETWGETIFASIVRVTETKAVTDKENQAGELIILERTYNDPHNLQAFYKYHYYPHIKLIE